MKVHGSQKDKSKVGNYLIDYVGETENSIICMNVNRIQACIKSLGCEEVILTFDPENPTGLTIKPANEETLYTEVFTSASVPQEAQ